MVVDRLGITAGGKTPSPPGRDRDEFPGTLAVVKFLRSKLTHPALRAPLRGGDSGSESPPGRAGVGWRGQMLASVLTIGVKTHWRRHLPEKCRNFRPFQFLKPIATGQAQKRQKNR